MTLNRDIYQEIDAFAPFATQLKLDNAGFLAGDPEAPVERAGICLDITHDTVKEALALGCTLLISHHPVIFDPLRALLAESVLYRMARNGLSAICAHTNLDACEGGVNDALAECLGLRDVETFADPENPGAPPIGRVGRIDPVSPAQLAARVKTAVGCGSIRFTCPRAEVGRLAVCGGAGDDLIAAAAQTGADAFLTSEIKQHEWLAASAMGLCLYDAGHFSTEAVVLPPLKERLKAAFPEVSFHLLSEKVPYLTI